MPRKIVDMNIEEVSGVDKAANGRRFLIVKQAEDTENQNPMQKLWNFAKMMFGTDGAKDLNSIITEREREEKMWMLTSALRESIDSINDDETVTDKQSAIAQVLQQFFSALVGEGIAKAGKKISAARLDALKQMKVILEQMIAEAEPPAGEEGMTKGSVNSMPITDEIRKGLSQEDQDYLMEIEKKAGQVDDLTAKIADLEKKLDTTDPNEDIWKGVNPAIRKMMEDSEKRAKDAEDIAKSLREGSDDKERLAKAEKLAIPGTDPKVVATVMKSLAGDPETLAAYEATLKATKEQIEKGDLFKEFGRTGGTPAGSAVAKAEALANEMIQKNSGITREQALAEVWSSNPQLYAEYEAEQRQ